MKARYVRSLVIACGLFFLVSCAATRERPMAPVAITDAPISHFELSGRLAVRYDDQGFSGNVRWQHGAGDASADQIHLNSPLGQTVALLERNAGGFVLIADRKTYRAADAESLTREVLGWTLPLTGLEHWVLGRVAPGSAPAVVDRDDSGRLTRLTQNAWQIAFPRYAEPPQDRLPARIDLQYGTVEIKLIIDEWAVDR